MVLITATWSQLLYTILGILLLRLGWKYLRLWLFLQSLKKKGVEIYFKFPVGLYQKINADTKIKGDAFSWYKESVQHNPELRLLATHAASKPIIILLDPNLVKAFLSDPSKAKKSPVFDPLFPLMQHGLIFSEGNQWKKHRKTLSAIFRYDFIISQLPTIVNTARHIFSREIEAQKGKNIDILDLYQMITGELVFRLFFGEDLEGSEIDGLPPTRYLANLLELGGSNARSPENLLLGAKGTRLGLFKRNRDYIAQTKRFLTFCSEMIKAKKKKLESEGAGSVPDALTLLLQAQSNEKGDKFSDEEILHEFITFFFAGMDTTGHLLTMATYFFAKQSEKVQRAVMKEANELSQAGINITSDLINKSEVIHAFLKETLRLASSAMLLFPREITADMQLEDLVIPKGTMMNVSFVTNNYNPKYHPDPYRFNMNRWIQGHADFEDAAQKNPFIATPFSAGPRNCIGQHLAMIEGKIIWSIFLSAYNFTVPAGYEMHYKLGMLYEPREVLYLDIEKK